MNPTGLPIRNDRGGLGHYGAPRSKINPDGGKVFYTHKGVDYQCLPGQDIWAFATGRIIRPSDPYGGGDYSGMIFETKRALFKVFYFSPYENLIGKVVKIGDIIGKAQDISLRYPGIGVTPHVHVEILQCDPEILLKGIFLMQLPLIARLSTLMRLIFLMLTLS